MGAAEGARFGPFLQPAAHILTCRPGGCVIPLSEEASIDSWGRPILGSRCPEGKEASITTHSPQALQRMSQTEEMKGQGCAEWARPRDWDPYPSSASWHPGGVHKLSGPKSLEVCDQTRSARG